MRHTNAEKVNRQPDARATISCFVMIAFCFSMFILPNSASVVESSAL